MVSKVENQNVYQALNKNAQKVNSQQQSESIPEDALIKNIPGKNSYNVNLSSEARDLSDARRSAYQIATHTSPIREELVMDLKEKIQNGEYKLNSGNIADGIMREAIRDYLSSES